MFYAYDAPTWPGTWRAWHVRCYARANITDREGARRHIVCIGADSPNGLVGCAHDAPVRHAPNPCTGASAAHAGTRPLGPTIPLHLVVVIDTHTTEWIVGRLTEHGPKPPLGYSLYLYTKYPLTLCPHGYTAVSFNTRLLDIVGRV